MYWITTKIELDKYFTKLDLVGIYVAAVAHDLDHCKFTHLLAGLSNSFLTKTQDTISLVFNDQSVLENYHVSLLYQILLNNDEINLFQNLEKSEQDYLRRLIIESILATDMSRHFHLEKQFWTFVSDTISGNEGKGFKFENEEARIKLISFLVHTVDISASSCMANEHSDKWGLRCAQEFHDQWEGEKQRESDIGPATPFLQYKSKRCYIKSQAGFIGLFVEPMWESIVKIFPYC